MRIAVKTPALTDVWLQFKSRFWVCFRALSRLVPVWGSILWLGVHGLTASAAAPASAEFEFFEQRIRPLLAENCYKCHSAESEKLKGGLLLDSEAGMRKGGDSGPAVMPGDPDQSLLIKAVRYADPELQMPPKNKKLSQRQIADLESWVLAGAPWPAAIAGRGSKPQRAPAEMTEQDRAWWAFQPIRSPMLPGVRHRSWLKGGIDAFILAGLEADGLTPNPPATPRELIRRLYFDLIGLPPSPAAVARFIADPSDRAYEALINELLSLPQYGERWGRHWLDVVRFAQSNGYERDGEKPLAWRYRDYVIQSFNQDKPYDRFILEQLAGDELPEPTRDSLIATGFQRLGVWDDEPDDKRMAEFDELDDIVSTTSTAFLGLTLGCARCHEHKFDPIPQADYYQILAFFRNLRPYENARFQPDAPNYVPLAAASAVRAWQESRAQSIQSIETQLKSSQNDSEKKHFEERLKQVRDEKAPFEWALAVRERGQDPLPTHVLIRGNPASLGAEVQPAFLTVLGGGKPSVPASNRDATSTGRRSALAQWIGSPQNPLTARVMANRIWQRHFGAGIVKSTTDFGRAGTLPTHPSLLDWLAAEFIEGGWSIKQLHRQILLSNAYRMSSSAANSNAQRIDPGNDRIWRQNFRRLEAEPIRDTMLSISGDLNLAMGGRSFFPRLGGDVLAGASRPGLDWQRSSDSELARRGIYAYVRRTMLVPALDVFDYSNTTSPLGERPVTTVAPQALLLLNDEFMQTRATAFALRLATEAGPEHRQRVIRGYQLALSRDPSHSELGVALQFLERQAKAFQQIQSRLTFRPDVPSALSNEYMNQLQPGDFLIGPREGWSYFRGRWASPYEGIRALDRQRGPFALWHTGAFENGTVQANLVLDRAAEIGSILFRARADQDELRGYELSLDPRRQRVTLLRHAERVESLAAGPAVIPFVTPVPVKIQMDGPRIRAWLGESTTPAIDVTEPSPIGAGLAGIRVWGAPMSVDDWATQPAVEPAAPASSEPREKLPVRANARIESHGLATNFSPDSRPVEMRALQSFCLLLFNLNETIYVD